MVRKERKTVKDKIPLDIILKAVRTVKIYLFDKSY